MTAEQEAELRKDSVSPAIYTPATVARGGSASAEEASGDGLTVRFLGGQDPDTQIMPLVDEIHAQDCQFSLEVMDTPEGEGDGWTVHARINMPDGRIVEMNIGGPVRCEVIRL